MIAGALWSDVGAARDALAARLGDVEERTVTADYESVERLVRGAAPAVIEVRGGAVVVLRSHARGVRLLDRELGVVRCSIAEVVALVRADAEARVDPEIAPLLDAADVRGRARARARTALIARRLAAAPVGRAWLAEPKPTVSIGAAMRLYRLWLLAGGAIAASAAAAMLWLACWWVAGRIALDGEASGGWVITWVLLLATLIPLRITASVAAGRFVVEAGARLKQRLLVGAMRSSLDDVRRRGIGEQMGRLLEGETLETAGLGGAIEAIAGLCELVAACWVLTIGNTLPTAVLLVVWTVAIFWSLRTWLPLRRAWVDSRRDLTLDAVDQMLGYRTRVVQQHPDHWHADEDAALARYLATSRAMDDRIATIHAFGWRGWLILGVVSLIPALIATRPDASLAVGLGGVLLAGQAFGRLVQGTTLLIDARLAWEQVAALATGCAEPLPGVDVVPAGRTLEVHDVSMAHRGAVEPILRGVTLRANDGDRILVQGVSGSGKSTLAMVLAGLRSPRTGVVFLGGIDRPTLGGEAWSRRVILVPQFHDNHVLSGSIGFNLLLGRAWPPTSDDIAATRDVCRELGLAELFERMPGGFNQQVGEVGWQLSHGERGRLFLARALLQSPDVLILDEALDALDPATRTSVLRTIAARVPIVIAIEHV